MIPVCERVWLNLGYPTILCILDSHRTAGDSILWYRKVDRSVFSGTGPVKCAGRGAETEPAAV